MKRRSVSITFSIFLAVGLLLLAISLVLWYNTAKYNNTAVKTTGTVVDLLAKSDRTFSPVVTYDDANGVKHRYISSFSSKPAGYKIGETVAIYYDPKNPDNAEIAGWQQYFGSLITGGLGFIFSALGLGYFVVRKISHSRHEQLKLSGFLMHADIVSVDINRSVSVNNRHPFFIRCEGKDSLTGNISNFKSGFIWSDPTPLIGQDKKIDVYVDRNNPRKYYVDISAFEEK